MKNSFCFHSNYVILGIFILVVYIYILFSYYIQTKCIQCNIKKEQKEYNLSNPDIISSPVKEKVENYINNPETTIQYPTAMIYRDPKTMNSLDRIYNPLRYPYKSDYYYDQSWYPNLEIPFQVIGGGYRNTPTLGGTQIPIYNPPVPIEISNRNIAPINISTRGPIGKPQQMGVLYKINGNDNDYLPLFGRRKYPNDNKYEYYTMIGNYGVKVEVITRNRNDELGSNDIVFLKGKRDPYRVTIYETDFPQYIP